MPSTVRTISRLYLVIGALLLLVGALVIAVFAYASSSSTAACVNRVLGERATATNLEQTARYNDAATELRYERGQTSKAAVIAAKARYVAAQQQAAEYRAQHPAGRC